MKRALSVLLCCLMLFSISELRVFAFSEDIPFSTEEDKLNQERAFEDDNMDEKESSQVASFVAGEVDSAVDEDDEIEIPPTNTEASDSGEESAAKSDSIPENGSDGTGTENPSTEETNDYSAELVPNEPHDEEEKTSYDEEIGRTVTSIDNESSVEEIYPPENGIVEETVGSSEEDNTAVKSDSSDDELAEEEKTDGASRPATGEGSEPPTDKTEDEDKDTKSLSIFSAELGEPDILVIDKDLIADADTVISEDKMLLITGGCLTVKDGFSLQNLGCIIVSGGELCVSEGGVLENDGFIEVTENGRIIIEDDGNYLMNETSVLHLDKSAEESTASIDGIDSMFMEATLFIENAGQLYDAMQGCGYFFVTFCVDDPSLMEELGTLAAEENIAFSLRG